MSKRKVPPEAQIIALFTGLSDVKKEMVMFGLNAIMSNQNPPEAQVRTRAPRAPKAQSSLAAVPPATEREGKEPKCGVCYEVEDHPNHDRNYLKSHDFVAPKSVARAARKSRQKTRTEQADQMFRDKHGVVGDVAQAASGGD